MLTLETAMSNAQRNGVDLKQYSASEVIEACEITGAQLTSYLSKSKFLLPSSTEGQGRARKFCIYDIYMIGLLAKLTDLTRNQFWSARSLEYLLYIGEKAERKTYPIVEMVGFSPHKLEIMRMDISNGVGEVHPLFSDRDIAKASWVIFAESWHVDGRLYGCTIINSKDIASELRAIEEGYLINATILLRRIDRCLSCAVGG